MRPRSGSRGFALGLLAKLVDLRQAVPVAVAVAIAMLLITGAEVTADRVAGWALIGTVAILVTYWIRRAWRPPPARTRPR